MAQVRDQLAGLVATYNHTTPAQVLEGRIRRLTARFRWALTTPQAPRLSTVLCAVLCPHRPATTCDADGLSPARRDVARPPAWQRRFRHTGRW